MIALKRASPVRRVVGCVLIASYLPACTSWRMQEVSPAQVVAEQQPEKIRVTLTDSSQVTLQRPSVSGDTLRGVEQVGQTSRVVTRGHSAIPLSNVAYVSVSETSAGKTAGLVIVGLGVVVFGVAGLICLASSGCY
jgi:hypothetical protein